MRISMRRRFLLRYAVVPVRPRTIALIALLGLAAAPAVWAAGVLNTPPTAHDQAFTTVLGVPQEITLFASDPDADRLSFNVVNPPSHGILSGTAPSFLYTPSPGYSGGDSFTWKASDGSVDSNVATGVISVASESQASAGASVDAGQDAPELPAPPPSWYTEELHQRILSAGQKGIEIPLKGNQALELGCLGYSPPSVNGPSVTAVSAGGCMVSPHGCTMNFIFRDTRGTSYIGTAGHCVDKGGSVVMQVGTRVDPTNTLFVTLAAIGSVAKRVDQGVGQDFGLVKIDPGWKVVPGVAGAAGPSGVFCGDPLGQPVAHYGHGYVFAVGPGNLKFGEVIPDLTVLFKMNTSTGYNWIGYGLPGDSGSPVMDDAGLAVGNLTHGVDVAGVPVPGLNFGTTIQGIFSIIGSGFSLVTVDGRSLRCDGSLIVLQSGLPA
jgi:hypothetical protein